MVIELREEGCGGERVLVLDCRRLVGRGALRALAGDAGEVPRGLVLLGPQMVKGQAVGDLVGAGVFSEDPRRSAVQLAATAEGQACVRGVTDHGGPEPDPVAPVLDEVFPEDLAGGVVEHDPVFGQQVAQDRAGRAASQHGGVAEDGAGQGWHGIDLGGEQRIERLRQLRSAALADRGEHGFEVQGVAAGPLHQTPDVMRSQRGRGRGVDDEIGCISVVEWTQLDLVRGLGPVAELLARPSGDDEQPAVLTGGDRDAVQEVGRRAVHPVGVLDDQDARARHHEANELDEDLSSPVGSELRDDRVGLRRLIDLEVADRRHERQHRSQVGREACRSGARAAW